MAISTRATKRARGNAGSRDSAVLPSLESYFRSIDKTPLLSARQERELAGRVAGGDLEARDQMVRANLRLVVRIARGYLGRGVDLPDLIEEGNLGLLRAVEGFDADMNTRFSTYASYWIKQSIKRAVINGGKTIRLPAYTVQLLVEWRRATARLEFQLGRAPTTDEVGRALGLSKKKLAIVRKALKVNHQFAQSGQQGSDEGMHEVLLDNQARRPDVQASDAEERRILLDLMKELEPREAMVLRMRFGMEEYDASTFEEIGERLGLTRERARQIQTEALRKLGRRLQAVHACACLDDAG